jgi:hypothetical protein
MLRVGKIAIAVTIVVAVLIILIHPYTDGLDSVARAHCSHRVVLAASFFLAASMLSTYNSLAASGSPVIQNAGPGPLGQSCTLRC